MTEMMNHLARQAARKREVAEAIPRPARVRFAVKTTGIGETRMTGKQAIQFNANMIEEPTFSYGVVALSQLKVGELPLATATVLKWVLNDRGLYTGAEVGFRVESLLYTVVLKFTLTFEGSTLRTTHGQGTHSVLAAANNAYRGTAVSDDNG